MLHKISFSEIIIQKNTLTYFKKNTDFISHKKSFVVINILILCYSLIVRGKQYQKQRHNNKTQIQYLFFYFFSYFFGLFRLIFRQALALSPV